MATALITGSTGLIGERVVDLWPRGDLEPVCLDRSRDDLLVPGAPSALVAQHRPAVVVHLAWCASGTPGYRHAPDNARWVAASLELAAAARAVGAQLLVTGTALDDGSGDTSDSPEDAYAAAKRRLRRELAPGVQRGEITWLRPFYVVSPHAGRPQVVDDAVRAARAGVPVELRTPTSAHDFVHVDDVARAVLTCLQQPLRGTVDIGTGIARTVAQLVTALGSRFTVSGGTIPDVPHHHQVADPVALTAAGWRPISTEELFRDA